MANYQYTQDLIADVLFRAGESSTNSQFTAQVLVYLNRAYQTLYSGAGELDPGVQENWLWARATPPGYFVLYPDQTVVVSMTFGSQAGTFTIAPSTSWAGATLVIIDSQPTTPLPLTPYGLYSIAAHTAGQAAFTLQHPFSGGTGGYLTRLFFAEYALAADCLRPLPPLRLYKPERDVHDPPGGVYECNQIDLAALNALYPVARLEAVAPKYFAMVGEQRIRISGTGSPLHIVQVEYDYIKRPADLVNGANEEPILPRHYRKILADLALFYLYIDKADVRGQGFLELAKQSHLAMALENRTKTTFFDLSHAPMMGAVSSPPPQG